MQEWRRTWRDTVPADVVAAVARLGHQRLHAQEASARPEHRDKGAIHDGARTPDAVHLTQLQHTGSAALDCA